MILVLLRCVEWRKAGHGWFSAGLRAVKKRKMTVIEMLNDNVILGSELAALDRSSSSSPGHHHHSQRTALGYYGSRDNARRSHHLFAWSHQSNAEAWLSCLPACDKTSRPALWLLPCLGSNKLPGRERAHLPPEAPQHDMPRQKQARQTSTLLTTHTLFSSPSLTTRCYKLHRFITTSSP